MSCSVHYLNTAISDLPSSTFSSAFHWRKNASPSNSPAPPDILEFRFIPLPQLFFFCSSVFPFKLYVTSLIFNYPFSIYSSSTTPLRSSSLFAQLLKDTLRVCVCVCAPHILQFLKLRPILLLWAYASVKARSVYARIYRCFSI